jgi:hypothetical protein
MEFLVLHAPGVGAEVLGLGPQAGALQRLNDAVGLAQEQVVAAGLPPGLGSLGVGGVERFRRAGQVLRGVIPVHAPPRSGRRVCAGGRLPGPSKRANDLRRMR